MNKKFIIVCIITTCTFIFANILKSQTKNSVYSMFGVGQTMDNNFGINRSMAGTGIAFQSGRSINYLNPASYLGIFPNSLIMEMGAYGIYTKSENSDTYQSDFDINASYLSAGLYFTTWWAFSFGIIPYSYVNYEINSNDVIEGKLISYEKHYKGTGGLNRVNFGNSFKIFKGFAFGFNASYIFGFITQTESGIANDNFTGYELINKRHANSFYMDYGVQYSINKNDWLHTIGFIYGAGKKLNTIDDFEFTYNDVISSLEQEEQLDIEVPQKFGVGVSVKKGEKFRAGFDYELNKWSNISFSNHNLDTNNSNRFSIGVEYSPSQKKTDSWLKSLFYRFGANYKNSYLEIDDTSINSMGVSFGIGIPYNKANTFNLSIEYGEEGTLDNGLIKNQYFGIYCNFSLYQFWAKKKY